MGRIYQCASRVIAWIGRDEQAPASWINIAINFAQLLLSGSRSTGYNDRGVWYDHDESTRMYNNSFAEKNSHRWVGLLYLCRRTYWSRLWIIQELVLAREIIIQCGHSLLSWKAIELIFNLTRPVMIQQLPSSSGAFLDTIAGLADSVPLKLCKQRNDRLARSYSPHTLFELFCLYQKAACTLVQDKLFGLLALSRECCHQVVNVDYNMSPSTLCQVFVEHHFKHHLNSITTHNREEWIYGLQGAFDIFLGQTYEGALYDCRLLSFSNSRAITSMPCKFRGEITTYDGQNSADPSNIVGFFPRQPRSPISLYDPEYPVEPFTLASIYRIPSYPRTNFQFKDADKRDFPPHLALQPCLVPDEHSLITGGVGHPHPGDLVYQISGQNSLILRENFSKFVLVAIGTGFGSMVDTYFMPTTPPTNDYLPDRLHIDYSNLWGCCVLFEYGLKSPEHHRMSHRGGRTDYY